VAQAYDGPLAALLTYGQRADLGAGWTKFSGEPVVSVEDFAHATNQTLELPPPAGARRISRFFGKADSGS